MAGGEGEEKDDLNRPFRLRLRKTTQPGAAWCHLCNQKLVYKSNGKKSILVHAADDEDVDRLNKTILIFQIH